VAAIGEIAFLVQNIGDATRHAGREVATRFAEDHHEATGHVLTTVIANAFNDSNRARVSDGETFACNAAEVALAFDRTVENSIADDDRFLWHDIRGLRRTDDDTAAGQALADIVVAVALQFEGDTARKKRTERLAGGAGELHLDRVVQQTLVAIAL